MESNPNQAHSIPGAASPSAANKAAPTTIAGMQHIKVYPPIEKVTKPNLTTAELAYYLNRAPQTLRGWACRSGTGPMKPKRIGGILAWSTAETKTLTGAIHQNPRDAFRCTPCLK